MPLATQPIAHGAAEALGGEPMLPPALPIQEVETAAENNEWPPVPTITVTAPAVPQLTFNPETATIADVADMVAQILIRLKSKNLL